MGSESSGADLVQVGSGEGDTFIEEAEDAPVSPSEKQGSGQQLSGAKVGRYVVLEQVGSGGMGVVCTAFDPKLDRKIALKLLKMPANAKKDRISRARARLIREAQALAKLNHPNIVTVHDVDNFGDRLYMAMEYVQGQDLSKWLEKESRPWRKIVEVFDRAGRGLQAAHAEGITHRDFKPSNVIIGDDGRVVVLDFGLAKTLERDGSAIDVQEGASARPIPVNDEIASGIKDIMAVVGSATSMKLTQAGRIVGTPAYMAPEQHEGDRELGPRTDQYSFAVALYESLYGRAPYNGDYLHEVFEDCAAGRLHEPRETQVPGWVLRVLRRALSYDPKQRYGSMAELLAELAKDPAKKRRKVLRWVGVGGLGVLAVFGVVQALQGDEEPCHGAPERLDGVWDEARRTEVGDALRATGTPYAEDTALRVEAGLDTYTADWVEQRTAICEATRVHREQSVALLDHRMTCLDELHGELKAVINVLADADDQVVIRAATAVSGLRAPESCASAQLGSEDPLPADPEDRAAVLEAREQINRAKALLSVSARYAEAAELANQASLRAEELGHKPTHAEALRLSGKALRFLGRVEDAEAQTQQAAIEAAAAGSVPTEVRAWAELVYQSGVLRGDRGRADAWAAAGRAALERAREAQGLGVQLMLNIGATELKANDLDAALATHQRALALALAEFPRGPAVAMIRTNLGIVTSKLGRAEEAEEQLRQAYAITTSLVGERHPDVARTALSLGNVLTEGGNWDEAESYFRRALEIRERVHGPESRPVAQVLTSLATVDKADGDYAAAEEALTRAAAIFRNAPGAERHLAITLNNLGSLALQRKKSEEGLAAFRESLRVLEAVGKGDSPATRKPHYLLCGTLRDLERYDEARPHCATAVKLYDDGSSSPHAHLPKAIRELALLEHAVGDADRARVLAVRALRLYGVVEHDDKELVALHAIVGK